MAKNCFHKSYKGSLDIDSLYQLGSIGFKVTHQTVTNNAQQQLGFSVAANSSITIIAKGNGYMANSITDLDDPAKRSTSMTFTRGASDPYQRYNIYLKNDDYYLEITNEKALAQLYINDNISDGKPSLIKAELDSFGYTDLRLICSNGLNTFGDISNLETCNGLHTLRLMESSNVYGDFNSLNKAWRDVNIKGCLDVYGDVSKISLDPAASNFTIHHTGITGDIVDFVAKQVSIGITSMTTPINSASILYQLTFNGKDYKEGSQVASAIVWESASKIAVYSGGTTLSSATTVYCYGYTQQEAEAAFSGKTIVRVDA